jgi:hypothetical protein
LKHHRRFFPIFLPFPQIHIGFFKATTAAGRLAAKKKVEYRFFAEFQSHEPEFDYLKSLEIEEKINQIKWCKKSNNSLFLLSTNGSFALIVSRVLALV